MVRGELNAAGLRFGIVVSEFNSFITDRLLAGALDALLARGRDAKSRSKLSGCRDHLKFPSPRRSWLPPDDSIRSFASAACFAAKLRITITSASETSRGIQLAQLDSGVPMMFCVLTCDTLEQAIDRAGLKGGNKGYEAGLGAVEMARLSRKLSKNSARRARPPRAPLMTLRRKSREFALQMLFEWDMTRQEPDARGEAVLEVRAALLIRPASSQTSCLKARLPRPNSIDQLVGQLSENWRLDRLAAVDRSILRLAIYELRSGTAPPKVVIDEALELAKKFSSAEAPAFLNGVLDAAYKSLEG